MWLWVIVLLVTVPMTILPTAGCKMPPCSLSGDSSQVQKTENRLEADNTMTNEVIKTSKDSGREACSYQPEDCEDIYNCGYTTSGVYTVWPKSRVSKRRLQVQVFCDMETDGGGWTVIQRRGNFGKSRYYFYRDWKTYKEGFGDITQDFWIGNEFLYALTNQKLCALRFDFQDLEGESRWALYDEFWIESERYNYALRVQGYSGNAGDSFSAHNGRQFTTKDRDNDLAGSGNCAEWFKGAWWYFDCHVSNLNGLYLNGKHASYADGIEWTSWLGYHYSLPFTEMKIRSVFFSER